MTLLIIILNLIIMVESFIARLNNYIFNYPNKLNINIHDSLINKKLLLIIRITIFILMTIRYIYQIQLYYHSMFNALEYLTQYTLFMTWLYFSLVLVDYLLNQSSTNKYSPMLKDWIGLLYQSAICLQFPVVVLFWGILYDYSHPQYGIQFLLQIGIHGLPLAYLLIDLIFNIYQFQKRHFLVTMFLGFSYLLINLGFSLTIQPVYKPINWVTPMCYVWITLCLLLSLLVHTLIRIYWQKYRRPLLSQYLTLNHQLSYLQKSIIEDI